MHHHRRMHAVKRAPIEHKDLAGGVANFFGGRAQEADCDANLVRHLRQRERRSDAGRGDNIMAAGVTDAGQAIVFGAEGDVQRTRTEARTQRGWQIAYPALHCEAGRGESLNRNGIVTGQCRASQMTCRDLMHQPQCVGGGDLGEGVPHRRVDAAIEHGAKGRDADHQSRKPHGSRDAGSHAGAFFRNHGHPDLGGLAVEEACADAGQQHAADQGTVSELTHDGSEPEKAETDKKEAKG